jgi:hypothetical protein
MKTQNTQLKPARPRIASTSAGLLIRLSISRAAVLALFFAGTTLLGTSAAPANTITVVNTNDTGPGSLRQALVAANDGDTIKFDSSLKRKKITLTSGQLNVDKNVTVSGLGSNNLAVNGNGQSRVFYINPSKTVTIDGLTVVNGYSDYGSGIYNDHAKLTVSNSTVSSNSAESGGGIVNFGLGGDATLKMSNCTVSSNSAESGAGIVNFGRGGTATLKMNNCTVSGNSANDGGGISNSGFHGGATATITNCTISGNFGGGISNTGYEGGATLTITNSTVSGNSGGGIGNGGGPGTFIVTINNSTISGNSAAGEGGGISNGASVGGTSGVTVSNSTLSGNSATGNGGGIYNGCYGTAAWVELGGTILNAGSSGENIFNEGNVGATVTSLGYNLSSDDGGGFLTGPGDQINTDPMVGPLQNNGGPTFTHALLSGSPAINAGDPNFTPPPFFDQRGPGFDRVRNGRLDVGSFEVQAGPTPQ